MYQFMLMRFKNIYIFFILCTLLVSCSTKRIIPNPSNKYYYEISKGESVTFNWDFKNANIVNIEGIDGAFLPVDSFTDTPATSRNYRLIARRGFSDSLVWSLFVDVIDKTRNKEIRTGAAILTEEFTSPSYVESEFLNGVISHNEAVIDDMRILRVNKHEKSKVATINLLLLDKFGNYIGGFANNSNELLWKATVHCGGVSASYSGLSVRELNQSEDSSAVDFAVLIDNSLLSVEQDFSEMLYYFISGMKPNDQILISEFNYEYKNIIPLLPPEMVLPSFYSNFTLKEKYGFPATFNSILSAISDLSLGSNSQKALVVITNSNDYASLNFDYNQLVSLAGQYKINLFVIGIGNLITGKIFRFLTNATGGKYYLLMSDEIDKVKNVMSEILFSYRKSYEVKIPMESISKSCTIDRSTIQLFTADKTFSENIYFSDIDNSFFNNSKILSYYSENNVRVPDNLKPYLDNIISQMKQNDYQYELIGFDKGSIKTNVSNELSLLRAEFIKDYIIENGIDANRLIVNKNPSNNEGNFVYVSNMIELNNRVDIKPYSSNKPENIELICDYAMTEDQSQEKVITWENRGFKAYYERENDFMKTSYIVKLWGFSSVAEAEKAQKSILNRFGRNTFLTNK